MFLRLNRRDKTVPTLIPFGPVDQDGVICISEKLLGRYPSVRF
jgi:hypothetical protein